MTLLFPTLRRLRAHRGAVAMLEFAYGLPIFLAIAMTGSEIANFVTTKLRMSQVALHIADHAARMGTGSLLAAKTISETDITDVLIGAGLQAGELDLYKNGRVIISNLEPVASPNPTNKYKITWQRCRGSVSHASGYGVTGNTNMAGIGPSDRLVGAPNDSATMFVEVYYNYQPIIAGKFAPRMTMTEVASMTLRERRDLTLPIPDPDNVKASC